MKIFSYKWLIPLLLISSISYLLYTKQYYSYCKHAKNSDNYLVDTEIKELYLDLCTNIFKDFNDHSIMKYSLHSIYSLLGANSFNEYQQEKMKKKLAVTNFSSLKIEFKFLQFVHFLFYCMVLYIFIIFIPKKMIDIIRFFFEHIVFIIFLIFVAEGVLYFYIDLKVDLLKWIKTVYDWLPIDFVFRNIWKFFTSML
jgi:hypothetical protein